MKKYIRTEDHIYKIKIDEDAKNNNIVNYFYGEERIGDNVVRLLFEEEDLKQYKQADTIEELCDEFVWVWNKNEFPYSCYRQHTRYAWGDLLRNIRSEENYGKYLNNDYEIYGATWTNKGLIYVAKMNKDGKLELI